MIPSRRPPQSNSYHTHPTGIQSFVFHRKSKGLKGVVLILFSSIHLIIHLTQSGFPSSCWGYDYFRRFTIFPIRCSILKSQREGIHERGNSYRSLTKALHVDDGKSMRMIIASGTTFKNPRQSFSPFSFLRVA